jgi:hypothetical protein
VKILVEIERARFDPRRYVQMRVHRDNARLEEGVRLANKTCGVVEVMVSVEIERMRFEPR